MDIGQMRNDCAPTMAGIGRQMTLSENLASRKQDLEQRLAEVNAAITALEKHPELENLLNLIAKVRY